MDEKQLKELTEQFGKQAADRLAEIQKNADASINAKFKELNDASLSKEEFTKQFEAFKSEQIQPLNDALAKLDAAQIEQGKVMLELKEQPGGNAKPKSIEEFIEEQVPLLKKMLNAKQGEYVTFTGAQLKAAGVTSIGNSIGNMQGTALGSPYLPGIGGDLPIFDIVRDPNFILSKVNMGRTNQSTLAWINETDYQGTPGVNIAEAGLKPLVEHKFRTEYSKAKKAAAYIHLTEEFEQDIPQLASTVRRMLQNDVMRQFDAQIQTDVIAKAKLYEITGLDGGVPNANYWDAIRACMAQVAKYNFIPNTVAINPVAWAAVEMQKSSYGEYLIPPFLQAILRMKVEANKVDEYFAHVSDLMQYHVDMYKDFTLRMGWINDDLIYNQFAIVGELRYHSYISDARTKALCYAYLPSIVDRINGAIHSS